MRIESSVTSVSWIPSEAIGGFKRAPFDLGPMHYDDPPADQIDDVQALARSGAVRFINQQRAWLEVDNGSIVGHGQSGRGWMGRTKLGFGSRMILYPTIAMPDLRPEPVSTSESVRFVQTTGGRPALPLPQTEPAPVCPDHPADCLDHPGADHPGGWLGDPRGGWRQPLPAPLDLRRLRQAGQQGRRHRLRQMVGRNLRRAHPMG